MLVVTRKAGEKIVIGDDVELVVIDIEKKKISVGITAPKEIPVHREEIYHKIKRKKSRITTLES